MEPISFQLAAREQFQLLARTQCRVPAAEFGCWQKKASQAILEEGSFVVKSNVQLVNYVGGCKIDSLKT